MAIESLPSQPSSIRDTSESSDQKNSSPLGVAWIDWILHHRKHLIQGTIVLLLVITGSIRFTHTRTHRHHHDYSEAEQALHHLRTSTLATEEIHQSFLNLERIIHKHHSLQTKYEGPLAQCLLQSSDKTMQNGGIRYGQQLLERTGETLPSYAEFARSTLLITQGAYEEALDHAEVLQTKLEEESNEGGYLLRNHNLLRIATLAQQLDYKERALTAWTALLEELGRPNLSAERKEARNQMVSAFQGNGVTLSDYIHACIEALSD